jgi:transmembrane sensor
MMRDEELLETAIIWHARLASPDASDADWSEFTNWLDADPQNGRAYDRVALADQAYEEALTEVPSAPVVAAVNDNQQPAWYRRKALMAVAASVAVALFAAPLVLTNRDLQTFETKAGETRAVSLGDGSQIALNGSTRIEVDMKDKRFARLSEGEALFSIRHDVADPFTLEVGDHQLVDVGTEFNVRQGSDGLEVAVSEGSVRFNPDREALLVKAGNQVNVAANQKKVVLTQADPANVGGWRKGRLAYRNASLGRIAADLSRLIGEPVSVGKNLKDRRFSGLVLIDKDRNGSMHRLGSLLGVKARHGPGGWVLSD